MTPRKLLFPEDVRASLKRRYASRRQQWLAGTDAWPLVTALGVPREKDLLQNGDLVRHWIQAWNAWNGPGQLEWHERQWPVMGTQRLPKTLAQESPEEVASCIGTQASWCRAKARYTRFREHWPALASELSRHFDVLADYTDADCNRLYTLIAWFMEHPASHLYLRQVPVPGLDSKWIEKRRTLILHLLAAAQNNPQEFADFYALCGLRPFPKLVRMRLLDPDLQTATGGLADITAPVDELARLSLAPRCAFIVENLQTALAFDQLPGAVLIMGLGYAVEPLRELPWLDNIPCVYWGDLDTHGFAILSRARGIRPQIRSCLMDEHTLLEHEDLWGEEPSQHAAQALPNLTPDEQHVYQGLKHHRWGKRIRLEQERIYWQTAWRILQQVHNNLINIE